jgi:hypothetical protein
MSREQVWSETFSTAKVIAGCSSLVYVFASVETVTSIAESWHGGLLGLLDLVDAFVFVSEAVGEGAPVDGDPDTVGVGDVVGCPPVGAASPPLGHSHHTKATTTTSAPATRSLRTQ